MEPVSPQAASLISLITSAASVAVGFGLFSAELQQTIIAVGGTLIGAIFTVVNETRHKTLAK